MRAAKRKAQETLRHVNEDTDEERKVRKAAARRKKRKGVEVEPVHLHDTMHESAAAKTAPASEAPMPEAR